MLMDEKGIEIPIVDLDMLAGEHKSPDYLRKNPLGQVPALELDDGTIISESLVICRYLDEIYGEPFLFGSNDNERAEIGMWERRAEMGLFMPSIEYGHHTLQEMKDYFDQYPDWAESLRSGIERNLDMLSEQLVKHPFLAGDQYSIADITGFLGVQYARQIVGLDLPATGPATEWVNRVFERDSARSFRTALTLVEEFLEGLRQRDPKA